MFHKLFQKYF